MATAERAPRTVTRVRRRAATALGQGAARLVRPLIGVAAFFLLCQLFTWMEPVDRRFLPLASTVVARVFGLLGDADFMAHVADTLEAWAVALGLSVGIGVAAGIVLGSSDRAYRLALAPIELLRPVPAVAVLPLAILLFGQGFEMKVWLIFLATVWPILFNTIYGVHDVDPVAKDTARSFGLGRVGVLVHVSLPSAAPFVAFGVRIAASIGLVVGISAELLAGGSGGIGSWILLQNSAPGNADLVYAGSVIAAALGFLANLILTGAERRAFAWHLGASGQT